MKFNFYKPEIYCLDYRLGRIICELKDLDKPMNGEMFMMEIYYHQDNYGLINFLVGISIKDKSVETVSKQILEMLESGYLEDSIDFAIEENAEFEDYSGEKMEEEMRTKK